MNLIIRLVYGACAFAGSFGLLTWYNSSHPTHHRLSFDAKNPNPKDFTKVNSRRVSSTLPKLPIKQTNLGANTGSASKLKKPASRPNTPSKHRLIKKLDRSLSIIRQELTAIESSLAALLNVQNDDERIALSHQVKKRLAKLERHFALGSRYFLGTKARIYVFWTSEEWKAFSDDLERCQQAIKAQQDRATTYENGLANILSSWYHVKRLDAELDDLQMRYLAIQASSLQAAGWEEIDIRARDFPSLFMQQPVEYQERFKAVLDSVNEREKFLYVQQKLGYGLGAKYYAECLLASRIVQAIEKYKNFHVMKFQATYSTCFYKKAPKHLTNKFSTSAIFFGIDQAAFESHVKSAIQLNCAKVDYHYKRSALAEMRREQSRTKKTAKPKEIPWKSLTLFSGAGSLAAWYKWGPASQEVIGKIPVASNAMQRFAHYSNITKRLAKRVITVGALYRLGLPTLFMAGTAAYYLYKQQKKPPTVVQVHLSNAQERTVPQQRDTSRRTDSLYLLFLLLAALGCLAYVIVRKGEGRGRKG